MAIEESSVSIIIPAYNNAALSEQALLSALRTNAGEIIISDDNSTDNTLEVLSKYKDQRIRISKNETNIGLWENHLKAVRLAKLEWIKFLQQDDMILENGLKNLCNEADDKTVIVGALPIILDLETGQKRIPQKLSQPRRWSSHEYLNRIMRVGYELGNPSLTLIKKNALELDENIWRREISADYIMHIIVPTKGDVVIIPPGSIIMGMHENQESRTTDFSLAVKRMGNTLNYLSTYPNQYVQLHTRLVGFLESFGFLIYARGQFRRKRELYKGFWSDWLKIFRITRLWNVLLNMNNIITLFRTKYFGYNNNLDLR